VTVEDFVTPEFGPRAVSWEGDVDLRHGVVAGKLLVTRAVDETSISHYNVYWSNAPGEHGAKLGSIPSSGFMLPKCAGPTCSEINMTTIEGGRHAFERVNYLDNELATISASGPAVVRLTRFDTESYYDTLTIGSQQISGQPDVPQKLDIPAGPLSIDWLSDDSITASGWSFDLLQTGATAEFQLEATAPQGRGLEVVPAYGASELPQGVFVEVVDFDDSMPPSPGLAPASIHFADTDSAAEVVAGAAEEVPLDTKVDSDRSGVAREQKLHSVSSDGRESKLKASRPDDLLEPWLRRPGAAEERHVLWPAHSAALLLASRAADDHISCAVTLPGLDARAVVAPSVRAAFRDAIHAELPFAGPKSVTITKILSISNPAAATESGSARAVDTTVQFRVEPGRDAPPHAVDRVEARLILLSLGGPVAERFNRDLMRRLAAAGAKLPAETRSQVQQPQQVTRKKSGRALAAATPVIADDKPAGASLGSPGDEEAQAPLLAAAAAALSAVLASVATVVLVRRRQGHALLQKASSAALTGVHVQPSIGEAIPTDKASRW